MLTEHFDVDFSEVDWEPRYNIAPTQMVPVVRRGGNIQKARGVHDAMGTDPVMGHGPERRREDDQRPIRDSCD